MSFEIISKDIMGIVGEVGKIFAEEKIKILSIDIERDEDMNVHLDEEDDIHGLIEDHSELDKDVKITITAQIHYGYDVKHIKNLINTVEGIVYISIKKLSSLR